MSTPDMEAVKIIQLLDGRVLAYREYGDPEGVPIIFYHGGLNSRLFQPAWDKTQEMTAAAGVRLIAIDRPGYGHSSFHSGRKYMDNAVELETLLAGVPGLAQRQVALLGYSSGGPHALAAAHALALAGNTQVGVVGLASSDGPYVEMDLNELSHIPHALPVTREAASKVAQHAEKELRKSYEGLRKRPDRYNAVIADLDEATLQGTIGCEQDTLLERTSWDFRLEDVQCRVLLWQGTNDEEVPVAVGRHVASRLVNCQADFVDGEGHSMIRRKWGNILSSLAHVLRSEEKPRGKL